MVHTADGRQVSYQEYGTYIPNYTGLLIHSSSPANGTARL